MNVLAIFQWFEQHLNYWTITFLMTVESSFIPFPSEVVVPPAAYFACENPDLNIYLVAFFATLGALFGATINYYLSLWIGRPLIYKFANSRFGHICLINQAKVEQAEAYFDKHGAASTFIGRLIPAVRQLISIPAGLSRMNFPKFALYTSLGAAVWNVVLCILGYWLHSFVPRDELFAQIEHYNSYLNYAGYALGAVIAIFIAYNLIKKQPKQDTQS
ncbi:MAG: DedA family protein [Muribaculaceae bacterium]|nr:DedA family protein [Muribaculaceae bacterium]